MFGGLVLPAPGGGPKVRGHSLGTRSSCAASFGGILSTNAGERAHGRRHGSLERLPKESYAEALREQIVGHARAAGAGAAEGPPPEQDPFVGEAAAAKRAVAAQGTGKAAFLEKDSYAFALREQIALRDAHRAVNSNYARAASPMRGQLEGPAEGAGAPRGKRCLPPPMPSRESYAAALEEQIAAREAARQSTASPPLGAPGPSAVMLAQPEKLRGRRIVGPLDCHDKDAYAAELREQMAARDQRGAAARAISQEPSPGGLRLGSAEWNARGKRQIQQIPGSSKDDLTRALQEQMAQRAAQKAAGAHHLQAEPGAPPPEKHNKGKRQAAASEPPPSREVYAAALEEQVKEHRMRRAAQLADDFMAPTAGGLPGGAGREAQAARGRRHNSQIELPTKQALGSALREQMVNRGGPRNRSDAELGRQEGARPRADGGGDAEEPAPGPAHALPPRAPSAGSRQLPFEETRDLMLQEAARRPEVLDVTSLGADAPPQGGGREALGASARFGRGGGSVLAGAGASLGGVAGGFSSTEARRIRFADECGAAPDGHERTMASRTVDERADELRRLLDGEGTRPGPYGESP